MGVDYYTCANCRDTYPDCGPTWRCEKGHGIGPCCLDDRKKYEENDDGELLATACPCCAKGGTELERTKLEISHLRAQLAEALSSEHAMAGELAALRRQHECTQCNGSGVSHDPESGGDYCERCPTGREMAANAELKECEQLGDRLSELLTQTAAALKGDPGPLTMHDWSDLPKVAADAVGDRDEWRTQHQNLLAIYHTEQNARDALRGQLAEAEKERDAAKLEASKTALLRTMLHNHFCTVLGWEKVREMEGNPYMLANAVSHEVWRCKNRELDFTLLTNERDAAQARVGEIEGLLRECLPWLKFKTDLAKRIDAALATSPHRLAGRGDR